MTNAWSEAVQACLSGRFERSPGGGDSHFVIVVGDQKKAELKEALQKDNFPQASCVIICTGVATYRA